MYMYPITWCFKRISDQSWWLTLTLLTSLWSPCQPGVTIDVSDVHDTHLRDARLISTTWISACNPVTHWVPIKQVKLWFLLFQGCKFFRYLWNSRFFKFWKVSVLLCQLSSEYDCRCKHNTWGDVSIFTKVLFSSFTQPNQRFYDHLAKVLRTRQSHLTSAYLKRMAEVLFAF